MANEQYELYQQGTAAALAEAQFALLDGKADKTGTYSTLTAGGTTPDSVTDDMLVQSGGILSRLKTLVEASITTHDGYFNVDGSILAPSSSQEVYTDRISVLPSQEYDVKLVYPRDQWMWLAYCLYDASGAFTQRVVFPNSGGNQSTGGGTLTIPEGAYAVAFTYRTYGSAQFTVSLQKLEQLNDEVFALNTAMDSLESELNTNSVINSNTIALTSSILSNGAILSSLASEYGGLDNYGNEVASNTRIRTGYFSNRNEDIYITPKSGYMFGIWTFSEDDGDVWSGWKKVKTKLPISEKMRLLIDSDPSGTVTPDLEEWNDKFVVTTGTTQQLINSYAKNIGSISRQGYQPNFPPHSIAAYKEAYKCGFRIMLCDVRFTSDNVPVCVHDETINSVARNADGSALASAVYISNITLEQANGYDWGIAFGAQFEGLGIPTLESVARFAKWTNCELYIEVKDRPTSEQYDAIYSVMDKYNLGKALTFSGSYLSVLEQVTKHYPNARLGFGVNATGITQANIDSMLALKTNDNEVFFHVYNNNMVSGVITDDMLSLLTGTGIGFELTEIMSESGFEDFISDANNAYVTRCAIRYKPIEQYLYDYFME